MLFVVPERRAFDIACLNFLKPRVGSLGYGRACTLGYVRPCAHLALHKAPMVVRCFLSLERFDMAFADLVDVIDYPGFLGFAIASGPTTFADRHMRPLVRDSGPYQLRDMDAT